MTFLEALREVFVALRAHPLRLFLTLLGVMIGTGSLVVLAAFLTAGERVIERENERIAKRDVITVEPEKLTGRAAKKTTKDLDPRDLEMIRSSPFFTEHRTFGERKRSNASVVHRGERKFATVLGITPESWAFYRFEVERGRPFLPREFESGERVCIVGARIDTEMLHRPRMLEKQRIEIAGILCQVVGVLADESFAGRPKGIWSWKDTILVPDRTFGLFFQEREHFDTLYVQIPWIPTLERQIAMTRKFLEALLTRTHYGVPNFAVKEEETNATERLIYLAIHLLIYATAGISLVVGGINIMNIMLFSVTRRTREIGIRRALGASREEIRRQFVAEAAIIGGIGGLLGITGAVGLIAIATAILRTFFPDWPLTIPVWSGVVGFFASMATGLFFGWMPAKRAAELDPIEALRFE